MTMVKTKKILVIVIAVVFVAVSCTFLWMYRSDVYEPTIDTALLKSIDFSQEITESQKQYIVTSLEHYYESRNEKYEVNVDANQTILSITLEEPKKYSWQTMFGYSVTLTLDFYHTYTNPSSALEESLSFYKEREKGNIEYQQKVSRGTYNGNAFAILPYHYGGVQILCFRWPHSFWGMDVYGNYGRLNLSSTALTVSKDQGVAVMEDFIRQYEKIVREMPQE